VSTSTDADLVVISIVFPVEVVVGLIISRETIDKVVLALKTAPVNVSVLAPLLTATAVGFVEKLIKNVPARVTFDKSKSLIPVP
jgi:hypothetical protein